MVLRLAISPSTASLAASGETSRWWCWLVSGKEEHLGFYLLLDEKLFQILFLETKFRITDTVVSAEHCQPVL